MDEGKEVKEGGGKGKGKEERQKEEDTKYLSVPPT